ncbi:glutathione S-transferase zeta class-like isoform X3 [Gastrolobium bilobum]|uniref:glutathione S-transferase zeta class-like isoform X3 n=1 Tax=Gastrolobium bilobum TaxID=150636 RepID=UPI002AB0F8D8|nr:glutathione S-transferase zeta class-like isoform X3 [Gastrolobium bilobum]
MLMPFTLKNIRRAINRFNHLNKAWTQIQKSGVSSYASSSSPSNLVLYSYWQSSCSWRIRFALCLKGIPYEYKAVDLLKGEQFSPGECRALINYLEEKYTQKPLLPVVPQLRALNLQVASIVNSSIQPLHMINVLKDMEEMFGAEPELWAQFTIDKGFFALEKLLKDFSGTYATGEHIYMADVFLAPQITQALQRFDIDMSKFPILSRLYETYKALPEFQASSPQRQPDAYIHNS